MGHGVEEIRTAIEKLEEYQAATDRKLTGSEKTREAAETISQSFSGSWLGYHSRVYYRDLRPPPPGHNFSKEWGRENFFGKGTSGDWCEFAFQSVVEAIYLLAGNPDLDEDEKHQQYGESIFEDIKRDVEVLLRVISKETGDAYTEKLLSEVEAIDLIGSHQFMNLVRPRGQILTHDTLAASQGLQTPPHIKVAVDCFSYRAPHEAITRLLPVLKKAYSYISRSVKTQAREALVGTNVFIGHGRSHVWRDLKDFVTERMKLPFDEFNRVPVAGITNIARLAEMLDSAAVAFIVMTAEDEQADGKMEARTNVIHEVGLFQGRLGFTKAIVLLEEGCEEFSNIQGLGQIRFPAGNISAKFEDIRRVLEREKLVDG